MPEVTYIQPDGVAVSVEVPLGTSLMRGAVDAGVEGIEAQCGGMCSCATCHCYVDPQWLPRLPPPASGEELMLMNVAAQRRSNSRLSCQINSDDSLDGIVIRFPERQS